MDHEATSIRQRRCPVDKKVSCDCGWEFKSDDDDQLVSAVQDHARSVHNMEGVTREQALAQAKPA
jgi:predicted small metal-binding protein